MIQIKYGKNYLDFIAQDSTTLTFITTTITTIIIILILICSPRRVPEPGHEVPSCFHQGPKRGNQEPQA